MTNQPHQTPGLRLRGLLPAALVAAAVATHVPAHGEEPWLEAQRETVERILAEAQSSDFAWNRLAELTDTFGPRLAGSAGLEAAIEWAAEAMEADGLENVRLEKVMVPHWVRGEERVAIVEPFPVELAMLGLGNSVGTRPEGIQAELLIVRSFEELESRGDEAAGRIVLFNVPFTGCAAAGLTVTPTPRSWSATWSPSSRIRACSDPPVSASRVVTPRGRRWSG